MQRGAAQQHRRGHRNLLLRELESEFMLFQDLLIAPAPGAIELDDHGRGVGATDPIDAVLIAVERELPAIGLKSQSLSRIDDHIGRQAGEGCRSCVALGASCARAHR